MNKYFKDSYFQHFLPGMEASFLKNDDFRSENLFTKLPLSKFLAPIFPNENMFFYLFWKDADSKSNKKISTWERKINRRVLRNDKALHIELKELNKRGGIYLSQYSQSYSFRKTSKNSVFVVSANKSDGTSENKSNIFERENRKSKKTIWSQHNLLDSAKYQPQIRVETIGAVNAYWIIDDLRWKDKPSEIISYLFRYFGEESVFDLSFCLPRLPHFNHVIYNNKTQGYENTRVIISNWNFPMEKVIRKANSH